MLRENDTFTREEVEKTDSIGEDFSLAHGNVQMADEDKYIQVYMASMTGR